jgi:hypothetical protein
VKSNNTRHKPQGRPEQPQRQSQRPILARIYLALSCKEWRHRTHRNQSLVTSSEIGLGLQYSTLRYSCILSEFIFVLCIPSARFDYGLKLSRQTDHLIFFFDLVNEFYYFGKHEFNYHVEK